MREAILVVDLGSESLRSLIWDIKGRLISSAQRPLSPLVQIEGLSRKFNPQSLWKEICLSIKEALNLSGLSQQNILGISVTAQREGMAVLDRDGKEIYIGPNLDLRAVNEGLMLDQKFKEEIYQLTGHLPSLIFAPAKLIWLKKHLPKDWEKAHCILSLNDWSIYRLTGEIVGEVTSLAELGVIDIFKRGPAYKLLKLAELPPDIIPPLFPAGSKAGVVNKKAAEETGLKEGTTVVLGGPDTQCGLLALGLDEGEAGIITGWSTTVCLVTKRFILDQEQRVWSGCHILPDRWLLEGNCGEAGGVYQLFKEWLFPSQDYGEVDELLSRVSPTDILSFSGPQLMDLRKLGFKLGGLLFYLPLSLSQLSKEQILCSVLENIAFAIKANKIQLEEISDGKVNRLRVGGGLIRIRTFNRILADVMGEEIILPSTYEVSGLGAAICAAVGCGLYNWEQALKGMSLGFHHIEPSQNASEYEDRYERWLKVYGKLEDIEHE